jgi:hypothetical protein
MGCYPIFSCRDWKRLPEDLDLLGKGFVSLVVVTDPFGDYSEDILRRAFKHLVRPFKEHFVADLRQPSTSFVSKHHQYYARKALATVNVEVCGNAAERVDEWNCFYQVLVARHRLRGIKAFSRDSFAKQLRLPGIVMLRAVQGQEPTGAQLWFVRGDVAYSHLLALSDVGYKNMSAYALAWAALKHFSEKVRWIDWGAGSGLDPTTATGLNYFKRGWANSRRMAYLCGRIYDQVKYEELSQGKGCADDFYFPRYRAGEFS